MGKKEANAKYYKKHKKKWLAHARAYYYKNRAARLLHAKLAQRKALYGLDLQAYVLLLCSQNDSCPICGRFLERNVMNKFRSAVDHDHKTKKVRGILCFECNLGLGKFKDSPKILRKAAEYLEKNS